MKRLLGAACLFLLVACEIGAASPTAPAPTTAPPTADPSAGAATPTPDPGSAVRFVQVAAVPDFTLEALIAFDDGFLAAGCRDAGPAASLVGCSEAVILHSADGREWAAAQVADAANASINAIAPTPFGLVAAGWRWDPRTETFEGAAWRSADGARWERLPLPAAADRVFVGVATVSGRTVLAATRTLGGVSAGLEGWVTTDGALWSVNSAVHNVVVAQVVPAGTGLAALGTDCLDVCGPIVETFVWRSAGGLGWSPDPRSPSFEGAALHRLAPWGGSLVAAGWIGWDANLRAAVWVERDGAWRRTELPGGLGVHAVHVVATDAGLWVFGTPDWADDGRIVSWVSADGASWMPVPVEGLAGRDLRVAVRGSVAVAGEGAAIWRAEGLPGDGTVTAPAAPPSPIGRDGCLVDPAVSLHAILLLDPADRVRCLGGRTLAFDAWVVPREGLGGTCPARSPAWLAACDPPLDLRPEPGPPDRIFSAFVDPARPVPLDLGGRRVKVEGHFDDPSAAMCRSDESADDPEAVRGDALVERCRQSFVVTGLAPLP